MDYSLDEIDLLYELKILPEPGLDFPQQKPMILTAQTLFGEGRNQTLFALMGIANVMKNRVLSSKFPNNYIDMLLQSKQFSCFNPGNVNRHKMMNPWCYEPLEIWLRCYIIARDLHKGLLDDISLGAWFYHDETIKTPKWMRDNYRRLIEIDDIIFWGP